MELNHTFVVDSPIDETWRLLVDLEQIAPCMPGAQLQEVEGDEHRGIVKVKVGPITAQYKGTATFQELDEAAHHAVLVASGRETRGQGNARAVITAQLEPDGTGTKVALDTNLTITGKVAQFGRGVMADVSNKLLDQFVENLERDVLAGAVPPTAASPEAAPASSVPTADAVRRIDSPEVAPIDLLEVSGAPLAKRLAPVVTALVVLALVHWLIRRHRPS